MFSGVKAIIFDMDDTLYPEEQYVLSGFRAVAEWADGQLGVASDRGFSELRTMFGQGVRGNTFNLFLTAHGHGAPGMVEQMVKVYREHEPALSLFPEVMETVTALSSRFRLGLVSDGYFEVQQKKWAALGLENYFNAVIFSDTWGRAYWKPHHRPYEEVMARCDTNGAAAIYVGDNPNKDFLGANELGMSTVMVRRPAGVYSGDRPPSAAHAPDAEISNLTELFDLLNHE